MGLDFLQFLQDNWIAFTLGVTFTLISAAVQTTKGIIDFHEEIFVTRYLNKLKSLIEHTDENSVTYQYINSLRENEAFRIASGLNSYPEKAKLLMDIYLHGVISKNELKKLSPYLNPHSSLISIKVNTCDKVIFLYSFISWLALLSFGAYIWLSNLIPFKSIQALTGSIFMLVFVFIGTLIGRDYNTLRILRRVRERLIELNKVINPADSIEWNPTLW